MGRTQGNTQGNVFLRTATGDGGVALLEGYSRSGGCGVSLIAECGHHSYSSSGREQADLR